VTALSPEARRLQGLLANYKRNHPNDAEGIRQRRRAFLAARLEGQIRDAVAEGDLTVTELHRLAGVLLNTAINKELAR
jgi:hypothetical protein